MNPPINQSRIQLIHDLYSRLKPGQEIRVAAILLDPYSLDHYLSGTTSGFTHGYRPPGSRPDDFKVWTLFKLLHSLENDPHGRRSYVDPDRQHLYHYDTFSGIYTPIQQP